MEELDYMVITCYTFWVEKDDLNSFYFKKQKQFCTLYKDKDGRHRLHPENYYKDFYLDNESTCWLQIDDDDECIMIDWFSLDDNAMDEFKQRVVKYLLIQLKKLSLKRNKNDKI